MDVMSKAEGMPLAFRHTLAFRHSQKDYVLRFLQGRANAKAIGSLANPSKYYERNSWQCIPSWPCDGCPPPDRTKSNKQPLATQVTRATIPLPPTSRRGDATGRAIPAPGSSWRTPGLG